MSRTRYTLAFDHHNMVPAPAASSTIKTIFKTEDGILLCYGTAAAPSTASTYAEGCIYIKLVSAGVSRLYMNYGTYASPDFKEVITENVIQCAEFTLTNAQIKTLSSVPLELVAAPGSGYAVEFISAYLWLDYSGGQLSAVTGNIKIGEMNQGSFANTFISASEDRVVISHCGAENDVATYFVNTALTLKLASDPTGAGSTSTMKVRVLYRIHNFN